MSVLKDLYNGSIYPSEQIVPHDREYRKLLDQIEQERAYFEARLAPEDKRRFEELADLILDRSYLENYESFAHGFKLGMLLMSEVVTKEFDPTD